MKMGGGDGACNDRTGVKTSQDESAFVVAGAHVARVWLMGSVIPSRSWWRRPNGGAGLIHNLGI
jgi:hypothetical protein